MVHPEHLHIMLLQAMAVCLATGSATELPWRRPQSQPRSRDPLQTDKSDGSTALAARGFQARARANLTSLTRFAEFA